jgi:hypothetical protein
MFARVWVDFTIQSQYLAEHAKETAPFGHGSARNNRAPFKTLFG